MGRVHKNFKNFTNHTVTQQNMNYFIFIKKITTVRKA